MFYELIKETPMWILIVAPLFTTLGFAMCDDYAEKTWEGANSDGFKSIYVTLPMTVIWIVYAIIVKYGT